VCVLAVRAARGGRSSSDKRPTLPSWGSPGQSCTSTGRMECPAKDIRSWLEVAAPEMGTKEVLSLQRLCDFLELARMRGPIRAICLR
jgi:hypothetical protein